MGCGGGPRLLWQTLILETDGRGGAGETDRRKGASSLSVCLSSEQLPDACQCHQPGMELMVELRECAAVAGRLRLSWQRPEPVLERSNASITLIRGNLCEPRISMLKDQAHRLLLLGCTLTTRRTNPCHHSAEGRSRKALFSPKEKACLRRSKKNMP
ncbi:hypothetical protein AOLI_G00279100 [Acnodon oligacanthus]